MPVKFRGLYLRAALPKDARHGEVLRVVIATPLRGGGCCSSRLTVASQDVALEFPRAVPAEEAFPLKRDDDEARRALSKFDKQLAESLRRGDIRLLRSSWLLSSPLDRLPYRQQLEEREPSESPLLGPEEAATLLERGDRSIGSLTQCVLPHFPGRSLGMCLPWTSCHLPHAPVPRSLPIAARPRDAALGILRATRTRPA